MSGGFNGFPKGASEFLAELTENNNREWFLANKDRYERDVKAPLGALVDALALAFAAHDLPLTGSAKASPFRINRDVRFSNDKSPYKTNAGAVLSRDGTRKARGILYVHVTPKDGLMAMGFWSPEPADLHALREAIVQRPAAWAKVTAALDKAGHALSAEDSLSRLPKGFDGADPALADTLKLKHLIIRRPMTLARMRRPGLVEEILAFTRAGLPLLTFGWQAIERKA